MPVALYGPVDINLLGNMIAIVLKSPKLSNVFALNDKINYFQSLSGKNYIYTKAPLDRRIVMSFEGINGTKILELEEFITVMVGLEMYLLDHHGDVWKVKLATNELQTEKTDATYVVGDVENCNAYKEFGNFQLEFVGAKIT